jgi:hypothetical protein
MYMLLAAAAFLIAVTIQARWARAGGSMAMTVQIVAVLAPCGIVLIVLSFALFGLSNAAASVILAYGAACHLYIFLFTLVTNGVAMSLLRHLSDGPRDPVEIDRAYATRSMVERRVNQMIEAGLLEENGDRVSASARGRSLAGLFLFMRNLFGLASPESG